VRQQEELPHGPRCHHWNITARKAAHGLAVNLKVKTHLAECIQGLRDPRLDPVNCTLADSAFTRDDRNRKATFQEPFSSHPRTLPNAQFRRRTTELLKPKQLAVRVELTQLM